MLHQQRSVSFFGASLPRFGGTLVFGGRGEMDVAKTKKGADLAPPLYVVYLRFLAHFERANELLRLHPKVLGLEP